MTSNLFQEIPAELPNELITILAQNEHVRIERIVSNGHTTPPGDWYDQTENEWVLLLSGSATLLIENPVGRSSIQLTPGDHILLPAHQRHRVESTSATEKTIWLALFFD